MYGPSDMYGDMDLEDVDEFEGLEPDNAREIDPLGRFQRGEVRLFDRDFEDAMDEEQEDWDDYEDRPLYDDEEDLDDPLYDPEEEL